MQTFKFKLYNNEKKNRRLLRTIFLAGRANNLCVSIHRKRYELFGKKAKIGDLQSHLAKKKAVYKELLKRLSAQVDSGEIEWPEYDERAQKLYWKMGYLLDIPSQALQQVTERIDEGYKRFFDAKKKKSKRRIGIPGFKSARKYKSYTLKQSGWDYVESGHLEQNEMIIAGQKFKFFKSRPVDGTIQTVTIKRNKIGELYVCFSCLEDGEAEIRKQNEGKSKKELEAEQKERLRRRVARIAAMTSYIARAIDFGMKDFLVFDNGEKIRSPEFLKRSIQKLKKESRKLSRCVKGSSNWHRQRKVVARLHEKVASQRLDWSRKTAHTICQEFGGNSGFIFVEDLNLDAMKRLWGRKISDISFGIFVRELEWIAKKYDIVVLKTGRFEKTSGVCSSSGLIKTDLTLDMRSWFCDVCGIEHDRDIEASRVIREAGLRLVSELIGDSVRRPSTNVEGIHRAA